jgi:hypothetical protein
MLTPACTATQGVYTQVVRAICTLWQHRAQRTGKQHAAQQLVLQVRNPCLRGQPVGVTQKYLVVTANYAARAAGVGKLMGIQEARAKCPNLVLVRADVSQLAFHVFLPISELTISSVRCHSGLRGIGPLEVCTVGWCVGTCCAVGSMECCS